MEEPKTLLRLVSVGLLLLCVMPFPSFRDRIPNGYNVPVPCKMDTIWCGVGHFLVNGTEETNIFGLRFAENGYEWTKSLCFEDSDGDLLTNGEELGDPDCVWTPGDTPSQQTGITHPGICDPWFSPSCQMKQIQHSIYATQGEWLKDVCEDESFDCNNAIPEEGLKSMSLSFTQMPVPQLPEYRNVLCKVFNVSEMDSGDFFVTAIQPNIDNAQVLHQMLLYGCEDDQPVFEEPFECWNGWFAGVLPIDKCKDVLYWWQEELTGKCFPDSKGPKLGASGYKVMAVQLAWYTPVDDQIDGSGVTLYYRG